MIRVSATDVAHAVICPASSIYRRLVRTNINTYRGLKEHKRFLRNKNSLNELLKGVVDVADEVFLKRWGISGYADRIVRESNRYTVIEYKTFRKSLISPFTSMQVIVYGVLLRKYVKNVRVEVRDFNENVYFVYNIEEQIEEEVKSAIKDVDRTVHIPGPHCTFCVGRNMCPVFKEWYSINRGVVEVAGDGRVHGRK